MGLLFCSGSPFLQLLLKLIGHGVGKGESRVEACGSRENLNVLIFQTHLAEAALLLQAVELLAVFLLDTATRNTSLSSSRF